jgi:hypothetical protein
MTSSHLGSHSTKGVLYGPLPHRPDHGQHRTNKQTRVCVAWPNACIYLICWKLEVYFQWKIFNLLEAGSLLNVDLMFK